MSAADQDVIMLLGDSITQGGWVSGGFAQELAHNYARKLDVVNRGLFDYNTKWAIPVFEQCFAKRHQRQRLPKVRILTIWFGANDAAVPPAPQHVPLAAFTANLMRMIRMITSPSSAHYSPWTRIILITPPPINSYVRAADLASRDPPRQLDLEFEVTRRYAKAVVDVAQQEKLPVVDVWTAIHNAAGRNERALDRYLSDGLHLNEGGYKVVYEELMKTISEKVPELHYDNLPSVYPPTSNISGETRWKSPKPSHSYADSMSRL